MKSFICLLIGLCLATQCFASLSESEMTTIKRFLGPSLMRIFNTTSVDTNKIEQFLEKNEYMAKYLSKFANNKKKAIREMPASFFHGLLYPKVSQLDAYEKISAQAFVDNEKYHSNWNLFRKNFPLARCYSANYTMAVLDFQNRVDWDSFDPMPLYFGIESIVNNIDGNTPEQKKQLEYGLKNMTEGLTQLEDAIRKAASNVPGDGCVTEILQTIESFKSIFSSAETLREKLDNFRHKNECCPIEKLSKIAKEIDHYYFESMASSTMAFRMTATDLGELLLKIAA